MKKLMILILSLVAGIILFSCAKEDTAGADKQVARKASSTNTKQYIQGAANVLVELFSQHPQLITQVKNAINNKDFEYMEDRILFCDFFNLKLPGIGTVSTQSTEEGGDFQSLFVATYDAMKQNENNLENSVTTTSKETPSISAEALVDYLKSSDISIYFPYPQELYSKDLGSTITIVPNTDILATSASGTRVSSTGSKTSVIVDEAYTEAYPVWFVQKEDSYIFETQNIRKNVWDLMREESMIVDPIGSENPTKHYEARISRVFCTQYCGLFEGDLELHFCSMSTAPTYNPNTNTFSGAFDNLHPVRMPRKYVRFAKKGKDGAWYPINFIFDTDWSTDKAQDFIAAYEYDNVQSITTSFESTMSGKYGNTTVTAGGKIALTYKSRDVIFGIKKWSRAWFFDIIKNGTETWKDKNGNWRTTDPYEKNHITWLGGEMALAVSVREYN